VSGNNVFRLIPNTPNDGYTEKGDWTYRGGKVRFTYRHALPKRVAEFSRENKRTPDEYMIAVKMLILQHTVSWSGIIDESDKPAEFNEPNLDRVPLVFLEKIVDSICGYTPEKLEDDLKT
jgi:hypothetical protein